MSLVVLACSVDRVIRCRDQLDFTDRALVDKAAAMAGNKERRAVGLCGAFCEVKGCPHRRQASFWRCTLYTCSAVVVVLVMMVVVMIALEPGVGR